ncbi:MAG: glycosyltransferase family 1 protein [Muribaculaceae bacterium]|nr:glycosyltransferase family 1 protein [Muribaculaceae bacterium]
MKILLLGDASNFHNTLAAALRAKGHYVVVASGGSAWMNTRRDIDIERRPGKLGTAQYALRLLRYLPQMRGFDIVQVHNPIFITLKPAKLYSVFDYLRRHNKVIIYEALGTDCNYVQACVDAKAFKYSDFRIATLPSPHAMLFPDEERCWLDEAMVRYTNYFISKVDGVISCLYEYSKTYESILPTSKLAYGGIPIAVSENSNLITEEPEKVRFFIGIQRDRAALKGTDIMLESLKRVVARYPDKSEMCVVENLPYSEYVAKMNASHVLLDQLYSYTPATNALIAMSKGIIAVSGAEPEYYEFIGEENNKPIINVSPMVIGDVEGKLEWIIKNKNLLPELSRKSRDFVLKHNDSMIVAQRHLDFWQKIKLQK